MYIILYYSYNFKDGDMTKNIKIGGMVYNYVNRLCKHFIFKDYVIMLCKLIM